MKKDQRPKTSRSLLHLEGMKGFTLIEAIVVIAIIGIIAAIAAPNLNDYFSNQRVKGAAENFYASLQNAKFEAAKTNQTISIEFQPNTTNTNHITWCYGMTTPTNSSCNCSSGGTPACAEGSVVSSDSYTGVIVNFNAGSKRSFTALRGEANGTQGTVVFADGTKKLGVRLSSLGRVSLCRPAGTTISGDTDSASCP